VIRSSGHIYCIGNVPKYLLGGSQTLSGHSDVRSRTLDFHYVEYGLSAPQFIVSISLAAKYWLCLGLVHGLSARSSCERCFGSGTGTADFRKQIWVWCSVTWFGYRLRQSCPCS